MKTFEELFDEIGDRAREPQPGSRTNELLDGGVHAIGKKVVEEAAEAWMAAEYESNEELAEELAQLLYHAQVLAVARGIGLVDIYRYL